LPADPDAGRPLDVILHRRSVLYRLPPPLPQGRPLIGLALPKRPMCLPPPGQPFRDAGAAPQVIPGLARPRGLPVAVLGLGPLRRAVLLQFSRNPEERTLAAAQAPARLEAINAARQLQPQFALGAFHLDLALQDQVAHPVGGIVRRHLALGPAEVIED